MECSVISTWKCDGESVVHGNDLLGCDLHDLHWLDSGRVGWVRLSLGKTWLRNMI